MTKIIFILLLCSTALFSTEVSQAQLNDIYKEAVLFIAVFGLMGIVSYLYSSRHAKAYTPQEPSPEEILVQKFKDSRVKELSKLLDEKRLTEGEFDMLKAFYES